MTAPRQILPGATYLLTRRCTNRMFLLRPSAATNAIVLFLLAHAAHKAGILVHAFCVMSNHIHLVVTDPHARVPAFCQHFGSLVARAMNVALGRSGPFWDEHGFSEVVLGSPDDIVAKAAYALANPVAAGLVSRGAEWPGLRATPAQVAGAPLVAQKPRGFFRARGPLPAQAELALVPPKGFDSPEAFRQALEAAVEELERQARSDRQGRFLGAARVLAQRPSSRPIKIELGGGLRPTVAARDKWRRLEVLGRIAEFQRAYREALRRFREGVMDVLFPPGTYQMRVLYGVRCEMAAA